MLKNVSDLVLLSHFVFLCWHIVLVL